MVPRTFLFIFHAGLRGLDSKNFRNSSYKEKTAGSLRVSRLSFRFLWLWYNNTLPQKCKVNVLIFSQKLNILFVYKFQFWSNIFIHQVWTSFDRTDLLIGRISVAILPLIMHFTTAICFFPFLDGQKFSIIHVLTSAFFVWFMHKKQSRFYWMYLNLFRFMFKLFSQ